ncbi:MAG: TIM-barrel domain-containing protein [Isosphaeraceae bacterium]
MSYDFVTANNFTPNSGVTWQPLGAVSNRTRTGNDYLFHFTHGTESLTVKLSFLSPTAFRVRFKPDPAADYSVDNSYAVINRGLGAVSPTDQVSGSLLTIDTGSMQVAVNLSSFAVSVFRGGQLISADVPEQSILFIPGSQVIAGFKTIATNARYYGFGEKAGAQLAKNLMSMTFFNYDNFTYEESPIPPGEQSGPLNPSEALYCSVPFLIEANPTPVGNQAGPAYAYGLFLDNPAQSYFNIGQSGYAGDMSGKYYFGALYGELNYYFLLGDVPADVVRQYVNLTGFAPMPPRYVFGYHQGCYGYYTRSKLTEAALAYRQAGIPLDGLHIDIDFQDNYRTFTSSNLKFPDAAGMFAQLRALGLKCSTNITSMISSNARDETGSKTTPYPARESGLAQKVFLPANYLGQATSTELFQGTEDYGSDPGINDFPYPPLLPALNWTQPLEGSGYYPDLGNPQVSQWYGQQYQYLLDLGLALVWQDMTDPAIGSYPSGAPDPDHSFPGNLLVTSFGQQVPSATVHNAYALLLSQATYEGLSALRPGERPFIIARGGYTGIQRYSALWTGDSASSWEFLQINVPEVLNFGLSGIPITGCDIGGFAPGSGSTGPPFDPLQGQCGQVTDYELLTRWMQLGSFLPWYRNHYDGYAKAFQEPFKYGDPVPANCSKYVQLRYRMLQVYYDAMYVAHTTGIPIARALFLNDPQDVQTYDYCDTQFYVGDNVLVAPIVAGPGQWTRDVYLPEPSRWYAFQDNQSPLLPVVDPGLVQGYYADLTLVPVYIRAGAILPMLELEQYVGQLPYNPLTFNIYPGPASTYQLYQDDGTSTGYTTGAYRLTQISHGSDATGQWVRLRRVHDGYRPPAPFYYVALLQPPSPPPVAPSRVTVGGTSIPFLGNNPPALTASTKSACYYNSNLNITFIKVFDTQADVTIVAS